MTDYAQFETPEAVRAALLEGRSPEVLSKFPPCSWMPMLGENWTVERIADYMAVNYQFRAPLPAVQASDVAAALDRMDALLDPERGLLSVPYTSATANASRADMATIRAAIASAPAPKDELNNSGEHPSGLDECPITGRKFWGNIEHPELGLVATYGGPYDTYTIPVRGEDDELRCERFDHDRDEWIEGGEPVGYFSSEQPDATPAVQAEGDWVRVPRSFCEKLFSVLQYYSNECTYQGERITGVLAGCQRGPEPSARALTWEASQVLPELQRLAATPAPPEKAETRSVRAWVNELPLSGDRTEYWVCVGHSREHYLSVRVTSIRGRAEYEVAEWNHMLGHGPNPDILAFDTDPPADATQPATPDLLAKMGELAERMQRDANAGASMFAGVHDMLLALKDSMRRHANELRALIAGAQPSP